MSRPPRAPTCRRGPGCGEHRTPGGRQRGRTGGYSLCHDIGKNGTYGPEPEPAEEDIPSLGRTRPRTFGVAEHRVDAPGQRSVIERLDHATLSQVGKRRNIGGQYRNSHGQGIGELCRHLIAGDLTRRVLQQADQICGDQCLRQPREGLVGQEPQGLISLTPQPSAKLSPRRADDHELVARVSEFP